MCSHFLVVFPRCLIIGLEDGSLRAISIPASLCPLPLASSGLGNGGSTPGGSPGGRRGGVWTGAGRGGGALAEASGSAKRWVVTQLVSGDGPLWSVSFSEAAGDWIQTTVLCSFMYCITLCSLLNCAVLN